MGAIVAVVNTKGGVGKTAFATNIAARWAIEAAARRVALVDADPTQHSADDWQEARKGMEAFGIARSIMRGQIYRELMELREERDAVVVDCPGSDTQETRAAMSAADYIVMPLGAGQCEINALGHMAGLINALRAAGKDTPVLGVLNMVAPNCKREAREAMEGLATMGEYFSLHPVVLWDRAAVRTAFRAGLAVHELQGADFDPKALVEFNSLYLEVRRATA